MRGALAVGLALSLLALAPLCLPAADASYAVREEIPVHVSFEFDEEAVRPPADVEGFLVLESRSDETVDVEGTVELGEGSFMLHPDGAEPSEGQPEPLAEVDEALEPYATLRVPVTVPVAGVGQTRVVFLPSAETDQTIRGSFPLLGVAQVEVVLEEPEDPQEIVQMVSLPGSPAEITLTLTALPGSDLTDLEVTARAAEPVVVGDLAAGESRTVTLTFAAEEPVPRGYGGVHRVQEWPTLSGTAAGVPFHHNLYRDDGDALLPVQPDVYLAQGSTAFLVPPVESRLAEPTTLEVVVLNVGPAAVPVEGRLKMYMPGLPHLDETFDVDVRVAPDSVRVVEVEWTPTAAGHWNLEFEHDMHRFGHDVNGMVVAGPLGAVELVAPRQTLERGASVTLPVVLTALEDVEVEGVRLTSSRAPLSGVISIDDLLAVGTVGATSLAAGETETLDLSVVPKATGRYDLIVVVDTPDGPVVQSVGGIVVDGSPGDWAAWSPTAVLVLLLGLHVTWRRRWVT